MSDSDCDEEAFHDASDDIARPDAMDLAASIDEAKLAMQLFMNNKFDEARTLIGPWARTSMYHALGHGTFQFLEAVLTFEPQHIEGAADALDQSVEVCNRFRKKSSIGHAIGKMIGKINYDAMSEVEIHAELCYAECLLLRAVLTFVEDETLISFVKGGLRMRSCLSAYKECYAIFKNKSWDGCRQADHFESGVRMGVGAYNLLISMLPAKIMKLLEFIGFSGSRETGLKQLKAGCGLRGSLRQILCAMILLGFHLFVSYVLGYGDGDLELAETIIREQLSIFPNGVWYNFFKARLEYVKGHINEAIEWYMKAWTSQSEWVQFHHLCYWELMWANCFKGDWNSARDFADLLLQESRWSRTIYGYQKASFMCMMKDKLVGDQNEELLQLFKDIPSWKQRIAGKSIPMEKFAVKKCERFFAQGNKLVLPAVELLYLWNGFKVLGKQPALIRPLLLLVEETMKLLEKDQGSDSYFIDNKCLVLLLKGMCHKYLGNSSEAERLLLQVVQHEKELVVDHYLVPYSVYELGILYWTKNNTISAIAMLEKAKNNYKGYALESRLHFRIHSALADLRSPPKNDSPSLENANPTIGIPDNQLLTT